MRERNVKLADLARGIDLDSLHINNPVVVPDNEFRELLDDVLERGALEQVSQRKSFYVNEGKTEYIT